MTRQLRLRAAAAAPRVSARRRLAAALLTPLTPLPPVPRLSKYLKMNRSADDDTPATKRLRTDSAESSPRMITTTQETTTSHADLFAQPLTVVIFGATGDLARKKLFPALHKLCKEGRLPRSVNIVGYGRSKVDMPAFIAKQCVNVPSDAHREAFCKQIGFHAGGCARSRPNPAQCAPEMPPIPTNATVQCRSQTTRRLRMLRFMRSCALLRPSTRAACLGIGCSSCQSLQAYSGRWQRCLRYIVERARAASRG